MLGDIANRYTTQELINMAQWLIAENTHYTNYIHAAMYRKQMELVAQLHQTHEDNEHLASVNSELEERIATLTEAYATLFGDAMDLAEIKQHLPMPHMSDPQWCAQAVAAMCRSA
jgi:hypothetical protein